MSFFDLLKNYESPILFLISGLIVVLFLWNIFLTSQLSRLKKKNEDFFSGGKSKNLEELLLNQAKTLKILDKDIQELYEISNQINNLAFRGYHKIGMIRFNPFKDVGGDQSFSIAILNGKNNGITISSLYGRDGARFYAKSILAGQSEKHPLTEEEKEAIKKATDSKNETQKK
jgi:hypothetical protein